jgi:hypothetical protein
METGPMRCQQSFERPPPGPREQLLDEDRIQIWERGRMPPVGLALACDTRAVYNQCVARAGLT